MAATATARAKCTIHVSSLPSETDRELLHNAFVPFGEITDIQIPVNEDDGSIRGFAYIEFESADDAAEAIFNMNDSELYNRVIKVDIAKPHRGAGGLDSSLPVWQQEEWIKANITKDAEGDIPADTGDMGAKELAEEAVSTKPELNRRSMRGLEFAQEH